MAYFLIRRGLGPHFPVPVEVVPFCHEHTARVIKALPALEGCEPVLRLGGHLRCHPMPLTCSLMLLAADF